MAILSAILATSLGLRTVGAQAVADVNAAKAQAKVAKLGNGSSVEVKLRDTTNLKGHIDAVGQDSFTVLDKSGLKHDVAYSDVADVKKPGGGIGKGWLVLGGVAAGLIVTWIIVKPALCDGGAQTRGPC